MDNTISCPNCNEKNPFYLSKCSKCNSFLRDKVSNIDLWGTISLLIYSPVEAFTRIIRSEHKNFTLLIILFASLKFFIDSLFLMMFMKEAAVLLNPVLLHAAIILVLIISEVILLSVIIKIIANIFGAQSRIKDNFSIITFSFIPHALALCILFPLELVVFGNQIFSTNPSPFITKETIAYIMTGIECLIILWGLYLGIAAIYTQTKSRPFAIILGIIINAVIFSSLYMFGTLL